MNTQLLAQADLLLLLCDVFRPRRAGDKAPQMPAAGDIAALTAAAGLPATTDALAAMASLTASAPAGQWSNEYHRLFEGATVCPLNEAAYIRRDKGAILGDIAAFYQAFGMAVSEQSGERHDHLVTELEFVAALLVMAGRAEECAGAEAERVVREALQRFASTHVGEFVLPLCEHGQATAWEPAFQAAFEALRSVWLALTSAHAWPAPAAADDRAPQLEVDPPDDDCAVASDPSVQLSVGGKPVTTSLK